MIKKTLMALALLSSSVANAGLIFTSTGEDTSTFSTTFEYGGYSAYKFGMYQLDDTDKEITRIFAFVGEDSGTFNFDITWDYDNSTYGSTSWYTSKPWDIEEFGFAYTSGGETFTSVDNVEMFTYDWSDGLYMTFEHNTIKFSANVSGVEEVITSVPEPATMGVLALGLFGLLLARKNAKHNV